MPHANIWIRKENWDKWSAIEDKAAWLNSVLSQQVQTRPSEQLDAIMEPLDKFRIISTKPELKYCKNGHALDDNGFCFGKGCKYSR